MFLDNKDFPFTEMLEENWQVILGELERLPQTSFVDFPERELYETGWQVFGLYSFGKKLERNCELCPETTRIVEQIPRLTMAGFSWLSPGTHIKPHKGYTGTVLRGHLGLITPENCALRVGDETRGWTAGESFVFDDTTEHEAWNRSDKTRVVLLIDFVKEGETFEPPPMFADRMDEIEKVFQRRRKF